METKKVLKFNRELRATIETSIEKRFNVNSDLGQRTIGDIVEAKVIDIVKLKFGDAFIGASGKKSCDDLSVQDGDIRFMYDVKTHHIQKNGFSMPNLISVDVLRRKVLTQKNVELSYIFIDYTRNGDVVEIVEVKIINIYQFHWDILGIGAIGKGQIQIKNANKKMLMNENVDEKEWCDLLKQNINLFYNKQIVKTRKMMEIWS